MLPKPTHKDLVEQLVLVCEHVHGSVNQTYTVALAILRFLAAHEGVSTKDILASLKRDLPPTR